MNQKEILLRRVRVLTLIFIVGLVVSGATAIPLEWELNLMCRMLGVGENSDPQTLSELANWILKVRDGLHATNTAYPFMAYGTDWLAFGHFAIAVAFIGALRDPVRNAWLFVFGMIACALVAPYAFVLGGLRGIPFYWRLIDCSFGILGIVPVWYCWRSVREIEGSVG